MSALQEITQKHSKLNSSTESKVKVEAEPIETYELLEEIQIDSKVKDDKVVGFDCARSAVQSVVSAFCIQDDEELAARVARKNLQVMDRMIKMQGMKRRVVSSIRDSYERYVCSNFYL